MHLYIVWKLFLFSSSICISCLTFSSLAHVTALDLLHIKIVRKFFSLLQGKPTRLKQRGIMFFEMFDHAIQLVKHASTLHDY